MLNGSELVLNIPEEVDNISKFLVSNYANIRYIDSNEFGIYKSISNATFLDDGKYYVSKYINNISKRGAIKDLIKNEKYFGESEIKARNEIIEKISIKHQNNFFDYYD